MKKYCIYLAGSIPKSDASAVGNNWRSSIDSILSDTLDTLEIATFDPGKWLPDDLPVYARFWRCVHMIHESDTLIVWAAEKIWIGTAQEMLIAQFYGIPVISISPPNTHYNKTIMMEGREVPYLHPFLQATSDVIVESEAQAVSVFINHITGKKMVETKGISEIEKLRIDYEQNHLKSDTYFKDIISES